MSNVIILRPEEIAGQDQDRVTDLLLQFGGKGLPRRMGRSMQDLAVHLARTEALFWRGALFEAGERARQLGRCAEEIGLFCQAQVARDVHRVCDRGDQVAAAATLARLVRLGEATLNSLCDQDLSG